MRPAWVKKIDVWNEIEIIGIGMEKLTINMDNVDRKPDDSIYEIAEAYAYWPKAWFVTTFSYAKSKAINLSITRDA